MSIHAVGRHLQITALKKAKPVQDAYARSAFNRYYYGAYLTVRRMFREMDHQWSRAPHATYPELLRGKITKEFQKALSRAVRNGDSALIRDIGKAKHSVLELKEVMFTANEVRKIADYRPELPVDFGDNKRFSIRTIDVSEAHDWEKKANVFCSVILLVWRKIHV